MSTASLEEKLPSYNETQLVGDNDPPRYNATNSGQSEVASIMEANAPPTYDSLFGQIKGAKEEHGTGLKFFQAVFTLLSAAIGGIACLALAAILLAVPVVQLYFGVQGKEKCPMNDMIPMYLIVAGASGCVSVVLQVLTCMCNDENGESRCGILKHIQNLLNTFNFAWFIAGNVWVYRAHGTVQFDDATLDDFCDKTVYLLAFWCITSAYILIGAFCVIGCLLCICVAATS